MNILSFSGGRTSAYLLANFDFDMIIFCNTGKEAEGTLEFVKNCENYFNKKIIWLEYTIQNSNKFKIVNFETASRDGTPFRELLLSKKYLPNVKQRFCSMELKALTIKRYLKSIGINPKDCDMNLGIRADEQNRYFKLKDNDRNGWRNVMPLYSFGITKNYILKFWENQTFNLNINQYEGNCDLCFLKGIQKKINLLKVKPEVAQFWIEMEEMVGATFTKNLPVKNILKKSKTDIQFDFDESIECFCNID